MDTIRDWLYIDRSDNNAATALPIPRLCGMFDPLQSLLNGFSAKTDHVSVDDEGTVRVQSNSRVEVRSYSSIFSVIGTLAVFAMMLLVAVQVITRFYANEPTVNDLMVESHGASLPLPDIAVTVNVPNMPEGRLMNYIWPEFSWTSIKDGFHNRSDDANLMQEVKYGADCNLAAGYDSLDGVDGGSATWPVFCILNSNRSLQGRFGDAEWQFLNVALQRCGCSSPCMGLADTLSTLMANTLPWTGTCKSGYDMEQELGTHVGMNVWFRFKREDWANHAELQEPEGNIQPGHWSWWIFKRIPINSSDIITIELRHNTATVNHPGSLFDAMLPPRTFKWFDWAGFIASPTGTSQQDFSNAPLFSAALRVAWLRRKVDVRYMNVQEALSQISGVWFFSLVTGAFVAVVMKLIVMHCCQNAQVHAEKQQRRRLSVLSHDTTENKSNAPGVDGLSPQDTEEI